MLRYVVKRILILIPVVIAISILLFAISKMMPGDPISGMIPGTLKADQRQAVYDAMYKKLGMDKSLPEQYLRWLYNIVIEGDLGYSSMFNRPVVDSIATPLKNTIILNIFVNFLYLIIALPVGIRMAVKR